MAHCTIYYYFFIISADIRIILVLALSNDKEDNRCSQTIV